MESTSRYQELLLDDEIEIYATDTQVMYRRLYKKHGSFRAAARAAGVNNKTLHRSLERLAKSASKHGYAPPYDQIRPTPPGQLIRGVSTLYDSEGKVSQQWVKTKADEVSLQERLTEFVEGLVEHTPSVPEVPPPKGPHHDRLLTVYPMGDPHIGLYSWSEETGEDFNLEKAHYDITSAMNILIEATPWKSEALVLNLGDFFHADNNTSRTGRSGFILDVSDRWPKVMKLGARIMTDLISLALSRHTKVTVKNVIGNHDTHSAYALALILDAFYRDEPRVEVDVSPSKFWYKRFGSTLIGSTHGDEIKLTDLPGIMAVDQPEAWGLTKHRYWYTGHIHHKTVIEQHGVLIESFRTLAAKDIWTHERGYRAGRDMQAIVIHDEYGEVARHRVDILRARS